MLRGISAKGLGVMNQRWNALRNLPRNRLVPMVGGACVMLSTLMAVLVTPWSLAVTAFIGANLVLYGAL